MLNAEEENKNKGTEKNRKTIIEMAYLKQNILIYELKVEANGLSNSTKGDFMKRN